MSFSQCTMHPVAPSNRSISRCLLPFFSYFFLLAQHDDITTKCTKQKNQLSISVSRKRSASTRSASRERWRHNHRIEGLLGGGEVVEVLDAAIAPQIHRFSADILDLLDLKWDSTIISQLNKETYEEYITSSGLRSCIQWNGADLESRYVELTPPMLTLVCVSKNSSTAGSNGKPQNCKMSWVISLGLKDRSS